MPKQSQNRETNSCYWIACHSLSSTLCIFVHLCTVSIHFVPPHRRSPAKLGTMVVDVAELIAQREEDEEGLEGLQFQLRANWYHMISPSYGENPMRIPHYGCRQMYWAAALLGYWEHLLSMNVNETSPLWQLTSTALSVKPKPKF